MAALDSASSSAVSTIGSFSYDVFLNFRGEDTRNYFTAFLYKSLKDRGINVFIDNENLRTGEAIGPTLLGAIEESKISIPVFSKGYADSKWCLLELAQIVQCQRTNGQLILPIFFYVEPSHVRNQTGSFEEAFREHEKIFAPHIIESWGEALRVVGNLKGIVVDETKDQAESVELVVKKVLSELVSSTHLAECKNRIDMDSRVNDLLSLLSIGSNDVQFVGICGFGGIGKTTIAKAVYNCILSTFNKHSFLSDVREQAMQYMGIVSLQKRLLKDIFKIDFDIGDFHGRKKLIEERVCKEKVFLVLDDVDSKEQICALAGGLNWFGQGSRVIITTRDEHILNMAKVNKDKIYRPLLLDHEDSLQLFSWHAFQSEQPPEEYMQLSRDVAIHSGGLPLTLEVFGSYLSDLSDKDEWECTLQTLKEIPLEQVQRRLKISYDNLENDYQKSIFLDAACFFIGWEKETIISIWDALGYNPKSVIHILIKRSLLKFEDDMYAGCCLRMHDQIRDMGREIVLEESRMEPCKRSRLWSRGDILEVLEAHKATDMNMIKGMSLPFSWHISLTSEHFEMISNLRFLSIAHANFEGDFSCLPSTLRWFGGQCREILPTNFYHKKLVHLDLPGSEFEQVWNIRTEDKNKRFHNLKVLNLSCCEYLSKSPDFSWFPYLEELDLGKCSLLDELDESIGQLNRLKSLILRLCLSLRKLPKSIGDLKSIVKLDLLMTKIKELPDSISRVGSLKELILKSCSSLKELPDGVGLLEKLEVLDMRGCIKLEKLPRSMGRMKYLDTIDLKQMSITKFPNDFSMTQNLMKLKINQLRLESLKVDMTPLKSLKQLKICECKNFGYILALPSSLVELDCAHCDSLLRLPDLSQLKFLTILNHSYCPKLVGIRGIEGTKSLKEWDARGCSNLTYTPSLIKGTLLPGRLSGQYGYSYSLTANDEIYNNGFILCIVLKFLPLPKPHQYLGDDLRSISANISATIHKKVKKISCFHTLIIKDVEYTTDRDIICILHFKGFEWFGIPLQEKEAIEILDIRTDIGTVKFCEILFKNRIPDQKKPNSSHLMVPDLLKWSYVNDDGGEITLHYWPNKQQKQGFLRRFRFNSVSDVMGGKGRDFEEQ
ncbi:disease resistance protein RPV1-like isoform X2 [Macadamia integrifolia]|uniref:disease resistance protein RPV1-like isoform X2 n=1 Tax=Macadamia integrifolia TaxID=60698 RepID=UPI001C501F90|nr:disease resistance protein RPV1-like isoform X2 [Macadamia integrifolia]